MTSGLIPGVVETPIRRPQEEGGSPISEAKNFTMLILSYGSIGASAILAAVFLVLCCRDRGPRDADSLEGDADADAANATAHFLLANDLLEETHTKDETSSGRL